MHGSGHVNKMQIRKASRKQITGFVFTKLKLPEDKNVV